MVRPPAPSRKAGRGVDKGESGPGERIHFWCDIFTAVLTVLVWGHRAFMRLEGRLENKLELLMLEVNLPFVQRHAHTLVRSSQSTC